MIRKTHLVVGSFLLIDILLLLSVYTVVLLTLRGIEGVGEGVGDGEGGVRRVILGSVIPSGKVDKKLLLCRKNVTGVSNLIAYI